MDLPFPPPLAPMFKMQDISLEVSLLLGWLLETFFCGINTTLVAATFIIFYRKPNRRKISTIVAVSLLYALTVMHWAMETARIFHAIIGFPSVNVDYLTRLSEPLKVLTFATYITQTIVADGFMVYRMYHIWNRRLVLALFPLTLIACTGTAGYGAVFQFTQALPATSIFASSLKPWIFVFFFTTVATSAFSTGLIVLRIHRGQHIATQTTWITLRRAMLIAIESCVSYLVLLAFLLLSYTVSSISFYVALGIISPLIGINLCAAVLFSTGDSLFEAYQSQLSLNLRDMQMEAVEPIPIAIDNVCDSPQQQAASFINFPKNRDSLQLPADVLQHGIRRIVERNAGPKTVWPHDSSYLTIA